jgi:hypothetical protein
MLLEAMLAFFASDTQNLLEIVHQMEFGDKGDHMLLMKDNDC